MNERLFSFPYRVNPDNAVHSKSLVEVGGRAGFIGGDHRIFPACEMRLRQIQFRGLPLHFTANFRHSIVAKGRKSMSPQLNRMRTQMGKTNSALS